MNGTALDQNAEPLVEAMKAYQKSIWLPFDVPIHKRGHGNEELVEFLGQKCTAFDFNASKELDYILSPQGAIRKAEKLLADAFGAKDSLFMVNGTTSAVQTMIMCACGPGDKIILPRNVHISVINALVITGAIPVYINPGINKELGLALGISVHDIACAIAQNPEAKAILVNNPTYFGICSDLQRIVDLGHEHNMLVLVDEAHGTHNYFGKGDIVTAMQAKADYSAISMHKTGGALTQSAALLLGHNVEYERTLAFANVLQTSSASYLLMSSIDIARKNLVQKGNQRNRSILDIVEYAREKINRIGGFYAWSNEICDGEYAYNIDRTKLCIHVKDFGISGQEVYDTLMTKYHIQLELADGENILALVSDSDVKEDIDVLVNVLRNLGKMPCNKKNNYSEFDFKAPEVVLSPRSAFFAIKMSVELEKSTGEVCGEDIMCYPPGIPIIAKGERISADIIKVIKALRGKRYVLVGAEDNQLNNIKIIKK